MLRIQGSDSTYFNTPKDIKNLFSQTKKTNSDDINAKIVKKLFMQTDHNFNEHFCSFFGMGVQHPGMLLRSPVISLVTH